MRRGFQIISVLVIIVLAALYALLQAKVFLILLLILLPFVLLGWYDMYQNKHAIMRNFPIVGRGRYLMEHLRPKIYQYFIESDTSGRPIPKIFRDVVYQRSKKVRDTTPFGTQLDVYSEGYEWLAHSINPVKEEDIDHDPRVEIGNDDCKQPYKASLLNISAMSFGSLSKNAVMAMNGGAKIAGFAQNTGEGGIAPYHLEKQGDLIYQVGTGYFGCRQKDGNFDAELFRELMAYPSVKMAELKLSQGAKPGHGGILPAKKNTPEIAKIRSIEPGQDVLSPPYHRAFSTPTGLCEFMGQWRQLTDKPIGFKLCIGSKKEFLSVCKAMVETGIKPDFISVDGGEGGTGAAPIEFSNSVGMPVRDGLAFAYNALTGFGLKNDIKLIASGKIFTAFHMFRALALGADVCYSARAMMLAVGCIQALECNTNHCPTGVATHIPHLVKGLHVGDKEVRVANFHQETIKNFIEIMAAAGIHHPENINRKMVSRRVFMNNVQTYEDIYPYIATGCLKDDDGIPEDLIDDWMAARTDRFH